LGRKHDIVRIIKIYKFYKSVGFRHKLQNKLSSKKHNKSDTPKIIVNGDYQFILLNGLYHKLTKKSYTPTDMHKWNVGRQHASTQMKKYHKIKKKKCQEIAEDKQNRTNAIYNRELANYPEELRELFVAPY
jgi:hypothetical protein